jgi:AcrR family transcriptional regulator
MDLKCNILNAATEMFMRYGVKSITMDDISRTLGISKKTIYLYFEDKDTLVSACVRSFTDVQEQVLARLRTEVTNALEELIKLSEYMQDNVCNINPAVLYDVKKYHPKAWDIFMHYREQYLEKSIEESIKRGIEEGIFRPQLSATLMAKLRVEISELVMTERFRIPLVELPKIQMALYEHFIYGLCTLKGHQLLNKYKQIHEEN